MEYITREITGRFKHLSENQLKEIKTHLKMILKKWGGIGPDELGRDILSGELPLWVEVEFLDNVVRFEIECNPFLKAELMN